MPPLRILFNSFTALVLALLLSHLSLQVWSGEASFAELNEEIERSLDDEWNVQEIRSWDDQRERQLEDALFTNQLEQNESQRPQSEYQEVVCPPPER